MMKITENGEKEILSLRMKAVEEGLHITGKELARICGLSDTTIYRIDGRTRSDAAISVRTLMTICEKTGVDINWLMDFSNESVQPVWIKRIDVKQALLNSALNVGGSHRADSVQPIRNEEEIHVSEGESHRSGSGYATPGDRVRSVRNGLHMSQVEFARHTGLSSGNLAGIETGRTRLTEQTAIKIENACEHGGAEWLLTGNERNKDYPVNSEMIEWLKDHRRERRRIRMMMEDEAEDGDA